MDQIGILPSRRAIRAEIASFMQHIHILSLALSSTKLTGPDA